jgi:DNA-binding MarR family transcriptional regulator
VSTLIDGLDEGLQSPWRLAICAFLERADAVEFRVLRDALGIAEAHLSKQLRILTDAGYVSSEKIGPGRKRTWLSLTALGRDAFRTHVEGLERLLNSSMQRGG